MPAKTFKNKTSHLDKFFSEPKESERNAHDAHDEQGAHNTHDGRDAHNEKEVAQGKPYRLNTLISAEYEKFIRDEAWKARMNVTQYINALIAAEMERVEEGKIDV